MGQKNAGRSHMPSGHGHGPRILRTLEKRKPQDIQQRSAPKTSPSDSERHARARVPIDDIGASPCPSAPARPTVPHPFTGRTQTTPLTLTSGPVPSLYHCGLSPPHPPSLASGSSTKIRDAIRSSVLTRLRNVGALPMPQGAQRTRRIRIQTGPRARRRLPSHSCCLTSSIPETLARFLGRITLSTRPVPRQRWSLFSSIDIQSAPLSTNSVLSVIENAGFRSRTSISQSRRITGCMP
jgi:hypothetical protein